MEADLQEQTTGTRQAQAARRRQQLLEAAFTLFAERGYRATSVRDITRAAGVTEAVLYHYFGNKADLLAAVLAVYAPFAGYRRILEAADSVPVEMVLRRLSSEFLRMLHERRAFVLTLLSEASTDAEIAAILRRLLDDIIGSVVTFLDSRRATGELSPAVDSRAVGEALQGGLLIHFLSQSLGGETPTADDAVIERLVSVLLTGILPRS
ncbi:MAG: TetR/AcrR family transcriptional regulator [Thermomicrobiales bacterium]|nr:helix-turn-helix transcriptional regulator [Thermomicrobiales bacterium]MCO5178266.1 TetR/AcrR family transcriptional regulator [Thermomicrobiales bacterium]